MRLITEKDAYKAQKRVKMIALRYAGIAVLFLAAGVLLLIFSPEKYILFLLIDILLTSVFGVYSVYFFTSVFPFERRRRDRIEQVLSSRTETQFAVYKAEKGVKMIDGSPFYAHSFFVKGKDAEFATLEPFSFSKGQKYRIESSSGILLSAEEENE